MSCTIAYNRAGSFGADGDAPDGSMTSSLGGGLYSHDLGTLAVTNTIVAHNIAAAAPDVSNFAGNSTFAHNLIADGTGASGIADNVDGNLVGTADAPIDPMLAPLSLDRAATMTHALLDGTPALDAGAATAAPATDQRGIGRSTVPDIGAFELGAHNATPSFSSLPSVTAISAGQPFQYNITAVDADEADALTISAVRISPRGWCWSITATAQGR